MRDHVGRARELQVWCLQIPVIPHSYFRKHVLAEARGEVLPPGSRDAGVRELARQALRGLYRAEAEALIFEGIGGYLFFVGPIFSN